MAYETLKDSIKKAIKQNGNQEITGDVLQATLLSMISQTIEKASAVKRIFPDSNPDNSLPDTTIYIAESDGIYTNFNSLNATKGSLIVYDTDSKKYKVFYSSEVKLNAESNFGSHELNFGRNNYVSPMDNGLYANINLYISRTVKSVAKALVIYSMFDNVTGGYVLVPDYETYKYKSSDEKVIKLHKGFNLIMLDEPFEIFDKSFIAVRNSGGTYFSKSFLSSDTPTFKLDDSTGKFVNINNIQELYTSIIYDNANRYSENMIKAYAHRDVGPNSSNFLGTCNFDLSIYNKAADDAFYANITAENTNLEYEVYGIILRKVNKSGYVRVVVVDDYEKTLLSDSVTGPKWTEVEAMSERYYVEKAIDVNNEFGTFIRFLKPKHIGKNSVLMIQAPDVVMYGWEYGNPDGFSESRMLSVSTTRKPEMQHGNQLLYSLCYDNSVNDMRSAVFKNLKNAKFFRKTFSIIGDSISTFAGYNPDGYEVFYPAGNVSSVDKTWWKTLERRSGLKLLVNASWSGCLLTGLIDEKYGAGAACSIKRAKDLSKGGNSPDIIIVYAGINNFNVTAPGDNHAKTKPINSGYADEFNVAFATMIKNVKSLYPQAKIFCCTLLERYNTENEYNNGYPNINKFNCTIEDYNDVIRIIARQMGCCVIELSEAGYGFFNYSSYTIDNLHPNAAGHQRLANVIYNNLLKQY